MLGVIIQGATRKTTVSVKIGVPGEFCEGQNAEEWWLKNPPLGDLTGDGANPTYLMRGLQQAGAEGNQPRETRIRESQPFNVEGIFSASDVIQHVGELIRPQDGFVVGA